MKKNIKNIFLTEILPWYRKHGRKLPWRKTKITAYEVWISEVMLQQTQVSRVVEYYARFLKKFPTVSQLARANYEKFLPYWEGLGYYARGKNMLKTAKVIAEKYGSKFPKDKKLLIELPGIGEYTASAILSFAYGEPEVAFDTNFKKIFGTREKAEKAFRESKVSSRVFNSAVMDYGNKSKIQNPKLKNTSQELKPTNTRAIIFLHENHKKYYSLNKKRYEPFVVPKGVVSREQIKKYFLEKYGLRLSVRPPYKKEIVDGTMAHFINAQVLLGNPAFPVYNKREIEAK